MVQSMKTTLLVDDEVSFTDLMKGHCKTNGIVTATFVSTIRIAESEAEHGDYQRFVVDMAFEGEDEFGGVTLLEKLHGLYPNADLILLTGQPIPIEVKNRIVAVGGTIIPKTVLNWELLEKILRGEEYSTEDLNSQPLDVGEVLLFREVQEERIQKLTAINDLLVRDVYEELGRIGEDEGGLSIGEEHFSISRLKEEIADKTDLGLEIIRLHHELNRRLRNQ